VTKQGDKKFDLPPCLSDQNTTLTTYNDIKSAKEKLMQQNNWCANDHPQAQGLRRTERGDAADTAVAQQPCANPIAGLSKPEQGNSMLGMTIKRYLIAGVVATTLVGVASPAYADESSCTFSSVPLVGTESCITGGVQANSSGHFIYLSVTPFTRYELIDVANNITVAAGSTGKNSHKRTIFGLYSRYRLEVRGFIGRGYISNT
jgi:hypothetical protein